MILGLDVSGNPDPLLAAAIAAAVIRLEEERAAAAAVAPVRPTPGRWVASGRPRSVHPPPAARPSPAAEGWSIGGSEPEPLEE